MSVRIKPGFVASVCLMAWLDAKLCLYFLLSLVIHESGHGIAMKVLHVPIHGICLRTSGAVIIGGFRGYGSELICALSGPLAGFLAAAVFHRLTPELAIASMCLSAGNLLPLYPLDGGRVLRAALLMHTEPAKTDQILTIVTGLTCCLLMFASCWATAVLQSGLWPIFTALLILWRAGTASRSE